MTPADGYSHPITARQQLMRINRIGVVLWELRDVLERVANRVTIAIDAASPNEQIAFGVHPPAEMSDAVALVDALGLVPDRRSKHVGGSIHHRWYGSLGGFSVRVVWIELPAARDTQGRDPLPVGVGTGMAGRIEPVIADAKPWSAATAEALAPSARERAIQEAGRARSAGAQRLVDLVAPVECDNQTGQPVKFLAADGRWYLSPPDGSAPTLIAEGPGQ